MPSIYAISGKLPKATGDSSVVQVLGTELAKGMMVTFVSSKAKSKLQVWIGTVKEENAKGSWSVDIEAVTENVSDEINEIRAVVGKPSDKLKEIEDTDELKKPLPVPQPPVPPPAPGGFIYVPVSWVKSK